MNYLEHSLFTEFEKYNVVMHGHFKLTTGRHSNIYINKDAAFCIPKLLNEIILNMLININRLKFDVVTGPAIAGAVLAAPIAYVTKKILVYPEKVDNKMVFRRGYDKVLQGKRVLLIEDIITTGGSVSKTSDAIIENGGILAGVMVIWNRSGWKYEKCDIQSLINKRVQSWEEHDCPQCKNNIPLQNPKEL